MTGRFLGQVPLVLGPGSWGFPGVLPAAAPASQFICPPGTFMTADRACRPNMVSEGNLIGQPPFQTFPVMVFPSF